MGQRIHGGGLSGMREFRFGHARSSVRAPWSDGDGQAPFASNSVTCTRHRDLTTHRAGRGHRLMGHDTCSVYGQSSCGQSQLGRFNQRSNGGHCVEEHRDSYLLSPRLRHRRALHPSGKSLPVKIQRVSSRLTPGVVRSPKAVVLPPSGRRSANIYLQWWNWCGANPGLLTIRVVLPSGRHVVAKLKYIGTATVPGCLDKSMSSSLDITPIQNFVP